MVFPSAQRRANLSVSWLTRNRPARRALFPPLGRVCKFYPRHRSTWIPDGDHQRERDHAICACDGGGGSVRCLESAGGRQGFERFSEVLSKRNTRAFGS